jgi:hypothetical protein
MGDSTCACAHRAFLGVPLAFTVSDGLKRTWSRETHLERQEKGLDPIAPQLSGKCVSAHVTRL